MTDTVRATPTERRITHDLKLSDGVTDIGLILCNSRGVPIRNGEAWSLRQSGSTRTSLQIRQGDADYSDYQLPYTPFTQKDWSGGRGNEDFEKDSTRYYDGNLIDTRRGDMILAGLATTCNLPGTAYIQDPLGEANIDSEVETSGQRYASEYTPITAFTVSSARVNVAPGENVTVEIIKDSGGSPSADAGDVVASRTSYVTDYNRSTSIAGAALGEWHFGATDIGHGVDVDNPADTTFVTVYISASLAAGTTYWIVITTSAIGYGETSESYHVKNETAPDTWNSLETNHTIYYKLIGAVQGKVQFFEYKGGLYAVVKNDNDSSSDLYLNGYRFVAASGSAENKIKFSSGLGITADSLIGCTLVCVGGTGYLEEPNYHTIIDNTTTSLTLETPFLSTPDNTSEYVILGSDTWNTIASTGITANVTDVCVANDVVYFAQGEDTVIRRMREYNNSGTWTRGFAAEGVAKATFLELLPTHQGTYKVWKFNNPATGSPTAAYADAQDWGTDLDWTTNPDEVLTNGGFETAGTGGDDVFNGWTEDKNDGTVAVETGAGNFYSGAKSCKLTANAGSGATNVEPAIYQDVPVYPGYTYKFTFMVKGDGTTNKTQYSIYDQDGSKYIVSQRNVPTASASFYQVTKTFTVPRDCYEIRVKILSADAADAYCYIDDASVIPTKILSSAGVYEVVPDYPILIGDSGSKITNVLGYGDPILPYVIKEDEFGSIANNIYAPAPISELHYVKSENNGKAAIQFGVYLFLSVLEGFERYYENRLDDIGPNKDEGLPTERQGPVSCVVSYPGGLFIGIDGGESGYSSVLYWNQVGYCEVYRATVGQRIRSLFIQNIPGGKSARLWIGLSNKTVWTPVCLNPRQQDDYEYSASGSLISSWFNGGFKEISKFWKSVQVYAENLSAGQTVKVSYQTDNDTDDDTWHALPETFDESPMQEVLMATAYTVSGKRWRYKITLATDDPTKTPRVKAITMPTITRLPPNKAWSLTALADDAMVDRQGVKQALTAKELLDQLETWADSEDTPLPLTMYSAVSIFNNKRVFIEPPMIQPIEVINEGKKQLKALLTLSVYEA